MSARSSGQVTPGATAFELDRFELVDGERYELEGRWSGIRGRIFIRPELTLSDGSESRRLLADLAHKPWQAADGDHWEVAFPCVGEALDPVDAELTVAPDITVAVRRGRKRRAETKTAAGGKRRGLGVALAEAQSELEQLRADQARLSERLEAAMGRAAEARAERDRAVDGLAKLTAEYDGAIRERDGAFAERDGAFAERDDAFAERDLTIREAAVDREAVAGGRDEALGELEQTHAELAAAQQALREMAAERDAAVRAGVEVQREMRTASVARDDLLKERDELAGQQRGLEDEVKRLTAAVSDAGRREFEPRPAGRRVPAAPALSHAPLPARDFIWSDGVVSRHSTARKLLSRAVALLALAAAIVVVLVVLHSTGV